MIENVLTVVTNFIINVISSLGYGGVALLMAIESAAIPLPSEIIMPFSGYLVSLGRFDLWLTALAGAVGSVLGSWVLYGLGRYGGRPLVEKYGRYVLVTHHDLDLAERFFARFGTWATFIGRVVPVVRTFISFPAGVAAEKFWPFTAAAFVGSYIWSLFLSWIGLELGENWNSLRDYFHELQWVIIALILLGAAWWVRRHLKNRIKN